jgi:hypothetical protein
VIKIYPANEVTACVSCIAFSFMEWDDAHGNWIMYCSNLEKLIPPTLDPASEIFSLCPLETKEEK